MPRTLKLAIVHLGVTPALTSDRLARAERLITQAAQAGTQLIALPEVFNTGYRYIDENFQRAGPLDGPTAMWMKAINAPQQPSGGIDPAARRRRDLQRAAAVGLLLAVFWRRRKP